MTLRFKGGDAIAARRIHVDPVLDLAILQINPEKVPAGASVADLDCTAMPTQGTRVIAYGNPGDMNLVATEGIVTGTRNNMAANLVMTDAEIANGSSGGPLIRISDGKIVGLVSSSEVPDPADAEETGEDLPVNFAEPIPSVCRVLGLLRQGRDPDVHHLGFGIARGLDDLRPVVGAIFADQPSLRMGDLIVSVNGKGPVGSAGEFFDMLRGVSSNVRLRRGDALYPCMALSSRTAASFAAGGVFPRAIPLNVRTLSVRLHKARSAKFSRSASTLPATSVSFINSDARLCIALIGH